MYINPVDTAPRFQGSAPFNNSVFRCQRFDPAYPGFSGISLTPGNLIEQNPLPDTCSLFTFSEDLLKQEAEIYPVPSREMLIVKNISGEFSDPGIFDMLGNKIMVPVKSGQKVYELDTRSVPSGVYFLVLSSGNQRKSFRFVKQ
jgi:hypothetical protein